MVLKSDQCWGKLKGCVCVRSVIILGVVLCEFLECKWSVYCGERYNVQVCLRIYRNRLYLKKHNLFVLSKNFIFVKRNRKNK